LHLARSEAVKRQVRVNICASNDQSSCAAPSADRASWHHGWVMYADMNHNGRLDADELLRAHRPLGRSLVIHTSAARHQIGYQPSGASGGSTVTFALCDARGQEFARYVIVSNSGRARVARRSDSTVQC
jgi:type IV fimbrial biogenesis protein FimT